MSLSPAQTIIAQVRRESRADAELSTRIADYLAAEIGEDPSHWHRVRADEIIAMVRESDHERNTSEAA